MALAKLSPQEVQALQNDLLATGKAPRTVINVRNTLSGALDQALRWGLIARNPVTLVDPPRVPDDGEWLPMDEEQAAMLLDAIHGDRLEALYTVALALGLRRGEALGLRWEDVDLDRAELHVRRSLQRAEGHLQFLELKTRKSRRTVDLPGTAVQALREHRERQAFERRAAGLLWQDQSLVFTSTLGTPMEPRNATRSFQLLLKRTGLPHLRFHDLRHACATLLLVQGVELKVVQEVLGHSSIMTTGNIYAHVLPRLKRDAAERMDGFLRRSAPAGVGS